jgi:hypothetical protein
MENIFCSAAAEHLGGVVLLLGVPQDLGTGIDRARRMAWSRTMRA